MEKAHHNFLQRSLNSYFRDYDALQERTGQKPGTDIAWPAFVICEINWGERPRRNHVVVYHRRRDASQHLAHRIGNDGHCSPPRMENWDTVGCSAFHSSFSSLNRYPVINPSRNTRTIVCSAYLLVA